MSDTADRLARAQSRMERSGLAALLLTTEADIRYFTGFLTRFWESPTRPWFLIVPASGDPVAVIPDIGVPLMRRCGLRDIRSWPSPRPEDDGVSLLIDTLRDVAPGAVGLPSGPESHMRMPRESYLRLADAVQLTADHEIMRRLRMIKSAAEVNAIRTACAIGMRAFERVPEIASTGVQLDQVFRDFQRLCLEDGADAVPYLAGAAGRDGYEDVISPATSEPLRDGDVLMLDTGLTRDGYFCDFDRNWSLGAPAPAIASAYTQLIEATQLGFEAAVPGATSSDLYHAMDRVLTGGKGTPGRLGHGLGMQLTEGQSLMADDLTELAPGMVITLEPWIETRRGCGMVHEECILITDAGPEWLTGPAGAELPVLGGH